MSRLSTLRPKAMRLNKKVMRAIHKIAFELLCFQKGPDPRARWPVRWPPWRQFFGWRRSLRSSHRPTPRSMWWRASFVSSAFSASTSGQL